MRNNRHHYSGIVSSWRQYKKTLVTKPSKYKIEVAPVPPNIEVEGDLLGNVENIKYSDHDV